MSNSGQLIPVPEKDHGVYPEHGRGSKGRISESGRTREVVSMKEKEQQEEHLGEVLHPLPAA